MLIASLTPLKIVSTVGSIKLKAGNCYMTNEQANRIQSKSQYIWIDAKMWFDFDEALPIPNEEIWLLDEENVVDIGQMRNDGVLINHTQNSANPKFWAEIVSHDEG